MSKRVAIIAGSVLIVPWTFVLFVYHVLAHLAFGLPCPF